MYGIYVLVFELCMVPGTSYDRARRKKRRRGHNTKLSINHSIGLYSQLTCLEQLKKYLTDKSICPTYKTNSPRPAGVSLWRVESGL